MAVDPQRADPPFRVVGLVGSLRRDSYNRRLLEALIRRAPPDMDISICPLGRIPHYNADLEEEGLPPSVDRLKREVAAADGLIIALPEYNAGVPGLLKNAIDWLSRPAYRSPLVGKPVALIAASPSPRGAARALAELRRILESTRAEPLAHEVEVAAVHEKVVDDEIVDPELERGLERMIDELRRAMRAKRYGEAAAPAPAERAG